jgi:hypothetical protein
MWDEVRLLHETIRPQMTRWWARIGQWWLVAIASYCGLVSLLVYYVFLPGFSINAAWYNAAWYWVWKIPWAWDGALALSLAILIICHQSIYLKTEPVAAPEFSLRARFIVGLLQIRPVFYVIIIGQTCLNAVFDNSISASLGTLHSPSFTEILVREFGAGIAIGSAFLMQMLWLGCLATIAPRYAKLGYALIAARLVGGIAGAVTHYLIASLPVVDMTRSFGGTLATFYSLAIITLILEAFRFRAHRLAMAGVWVVAASMLLKDTFNVLGLTPFGLVPGRLFGVCVVISNAFGGAPHTDFGLADHLRSMFPAQQTLLGYLPGVVTFLAPVIWFVALACLAWFVFLRPVRLRDTPAAMIQATLQSPRRLLRQ